MSGTAARSARRLPVVVAVLLFLLLTSIVALVVTQRPERARLPSATATPQGEGDQDAAAVRTVALLQRWLRQDGSAVRVGELAAGPARLQLAQVRRNAQELGLEDIRLRPLGPSSAAVPAGVRREDAAAFTVDVELTWRLAEVDSSPLTLEVPVALTGTGERLLTVRGLSGSRIPLWLAEPLAVWRRAEVVVAAGERERLPALRRQTARAVAAIRGRLTGWDGPVVVEAPAAARDFRRAAGVTAPSVLRIAAVTTTADGSALPGAAVRMMVNPQVYWRLGSRARQIVLAHETAHVALGAATTTMPMWLSEGMADHLALSGSPAPVTVLASQVLAEVRRAGPPDQLPGRDDFAGDDPRVGAAYEAAWLAVRLLARTYGEDRLLRFYRMADRDGGTDRAFRAVLGTDEDSFTRRWRAELTRLA